MTPPVPVREVDMPTWEAMRRAHERDLGRPVSDLELREIVEDWRRRERPALERAWSPYSGEGVPGVPSPIGDIPTLTPIDDSGLAESIEACERMARDVEAGR